MPYPKAVEIKLNEHERSILRQYMIGTHSAQHYKQRATIIIKASEGNTNSKIAEELGIQNETVGKWRNRYAEHDEELKRIEKECPIKLRAKIETILSDAPRSGTPSTFTDEQIACIIALACEEPQRVGLAFSHWTPALLRKEAIERGIVESISAEHIGRLLKR